MTEDNPHVIDLDVDAATAKGFGDKEMDAGNYQQAVYHYLDALDQSPDQEMYERIHYNLANAYRHLGDAMNCSERAKVVCRSNNRSWQSYGLRLFYWANTGEDIPGLAG